MPGLASPDQSIVPASEKVSSAENKSGPTRKIAEAAKRVIEKIRGRITRPHPDPDAALSDIVEAPDQKLDDSIVVVSVDKSQTIPEINPQIPLDPEIEYQKTLAEVRTKEIGGSDPFSIFKELVKENKPSIPKEDSVRIFKLKDMLRHQVLALEARRQGVSKIEEFRRLVVCLETDLKSGSNRLNLGIDSIPVIKALLETRVDPMPFIKALEPNVNLFDSFVHPRSYTGKTDITTIMRLLKTPNAQELLPLIQGMSQVPHNPWRVTSYGSDITQVDTLISLAETGNIPNYPPEFFDKVGILARVFKTFFHVFPEVEIEDLPAYETLIGNQDKLQFLSVALRRGYYDRCFSRKTTVFDTLDSLDKDGLIAPLTALIQSGISLDIPDSNDDHFNYLNQTQAEINQDLSNLVADPSVQAILADPDKLEFAQILRLMKGSPVSPKQVSELYEDRQDLIVLNSLIFGKLGIENQDYDESVRTRVEEIKSLMSSDERRQILLSPDFLKFVQNLQKEEIILQPQDYFTYRLDQFDHGEYSHINYPSQSVLVQLYKAKDLIDLLDPGMTKRIIEGSRRQCSSEERDVASVDMSRLGEFINYIPTILLLREAGIPFSTDNFKDAKWIASVNSMPLMGYSIRQIVPPDKMNEWLKSVLLLPRDVQDGISELIGQRWRSGIKAPNLTIKDVKRVKNLANLFNSPDFSPRDYPANEWPTRELFSALGQYSGDVRSLFTEGQPNAELAKFLIELKRPSALSMILKNNMLEFFGDERRTLEIWISFPQQLQILSASEQHFPVLSADLLDRYKTVSALMHFADITVLSDKLIKIITLAPGYKDFIKNGKPTRVFTDEIIRQKYPDALATYLSDEALSQYDDFERSVLSIWKSLPGDLRMEVINEAGFPRVAPDKAEKYRVAKEIIDRIRNSPSAEIKRIEKELIGQLWKLENPQAALEEIIGVFEKNNLPLVGKIYRVFETIYDNPGTSGKSILEMDLSSRSNLSPVLRSATPRERREIIYRDLLSINIHSGNPQLRNYLQTIRDGESVITKMEDEGVGALSEREKLQLEHFFEKMDMLYTSSLFGRTIESRRRAKHIDSSPTTSQFSLEKRAEALKRNFHVRPDQKLTDRISEMFLKPLGFTNIEDVLKAMAKSKAEADARNRKFAESGAGKIALKAGDRFKGLNSINIGKILERGSVAREYLGVSAGSDLTPYDSDTSLILDGDLSNGVTSALNASLAKAYGDIYLLVRDRGQFGTGANQYQSFLSLGGRHFGIRTGFASTEIDAMVLQKDSSSAGKFDDLFMTIAQNGVYIPVADRNGNIIFTPKQFDEYRKTFDGVSEYSESPSAVRRVGIDEALYPFPNSREVVDSTRGALDKLAQEISSDRKKVVGLSNEIRKRIGDVLDANGVALRGEFDTSIYGAELVDTGSTARGSNVPGDYDFDMSLQLDPNNSKRLGEIAEIVKGVLKLQQDASHTETDYIQVRGKGSQIIEGEILDIDIGIGKRSDEGIFASSDSIAQKLESIRATHGDGAYLDALANIVLTKKILKAGHAYKKLEDGGMGGIGVENWILLHNGNMLDAFQSFWQASHDGQGGVLPYEEFAKRYKIFDAGLNIKFNRHDNFIQVLKPNGYAALVETIGRYLRYL